MIDQIGVPNDVSMVLLKCFLQLKQPEPESRPTQGTDSDEKGIDTSQLNEEERELFDSLQKLIENRTKSDEELLDSKLCEQAERESLEKYALEKRKEFQGKLNHRNQSRLEELEKRSAKAILELELCEAEHTASKKRSEKLILEVQATMQKLAREREVQTVLECQKKQNGLLSLTQKVQLQLTHLQIRFMGEESELDGDGPRFNSNEKNFEASHLHRMTDEFDE
ncbi:hypothetical protein IL306_003912, partial [Fusarium sp. DS 682]